MIHEEHPTKVLFIDETNERDGSDHHIYKAVPFDADRDAHLANKFLYWPASALSNGQAILAVGSCAKSLMSHPFLLDRLIRLAIIKEGQIPTAAGDFRDGKIASWESTCFEIETPCELMPVITEALGLG